jgi:hypothetical protein
VRFLLGTHKAHWLARLDVPLFVSHRTLVGRRSLPRALGPWALDSGGFSELTMHGEWRTTHGEYVAAVRRYVAEIGRLEWVAPQDWMVEPAIRERTGLTTEEHQRRTIDSFLRLRDELGGLVIPVLQGWEPGEHERHAEAYVAAGVELDEERLVGVGSVCRRADARGVLRSLRPLRLHGFGVKGPNLPALADVLVSADSLAWSYQARRNPPLPGCTHAACSNCHRFALRWRERLLGQLAQGTLLGGPCARCTLHVDHAAAAGFAAEAEALPEHAGEAYVEALGLIGRPEAPVCALCHAEGMREAERARELTEEDAWIVAG